MKKFKIEVCGDIQKAGSDAKALERLENQEFNTEEAAYLAVDNLAANWANPQGVWDIVAVVAA
jgi:hypothetical protein